MRYFYLFGGVADSNGKLKFTNVRIFPSHDTLCRLLGIRDDFAALYLQNLLIVAPTRDKQKYRSLGGIFVWF